jgi:DNA replication protein DnaC
MPRLFAALALARGDGRYAKLLRTLARVDLLILDDWGPEPLNAEQRRDLLEIVEDRYDARSIIITSQLPVERWYEIVGNPTLADAILDRIIHSAYRIELTGDSMRKLKTGQAELEAPLPAKEVPKSAGAPASTPAKPHRK